MRFIRYGFCDCAFTGWEEDDRREDVGIVTVEEVCADVVVRRRGVPRK